VPTRLVADAGVSQRRRVAEVRAARYGITALYHADRHGAVRPFGGVALTTETRSYEPEVGVDDSRTSGSLVLGAHLPLSERLAIRIQAVQDVFGGARRAAADQLMVTAGFSYRQPVR
jgi:hypothetical protein